MTTRRPRLHRRSARPAARAGHPLAGRRILVTRPQGQDVVLLRRLRALGAVAIAIPTIEIVQPSPGGPLDRALEALDAYDWVVVTSANGARACLGRAQALRITLRDRASPRWAAIGPATARVLKEARINVAMTPSRFLTGAIARELRLDPGSRVLLPRTDAAPPDLAEALRARHATVEEVTAYRTVLAPARSRARLRDLFAGRAVDTVVFTSASTVRGLVRLLGPRRGKLRRVTIVCIGPVTAAAVTEEGFTPSIVAQEHTVDGLIAALTSGARTPGADRSPKAHSAPGGHRHA